MIHAESVKAVQELLVERGVEKREGERWGDYVARGLDVSEGQAEAFLEALDENRSVEDACAVAGISPDRAGGQMLQDVARAIGRVLGSLRSSIGPDA